MDDVRSNSSFPLDIIDLLMIICLLVLHMGLWGADIYEEASGCQVVVLRSHAAVTASAVCSECLSPAGTDVCKCKIKSKRSFVSVPRMAVVIPCTSSQDGCVTARLYDMKGKGLAA